MPDQLFFDIVKMVVALAFIVGLIYVIVFVLKRLAPGSMSKVADRIDIKVLGQIAMGSRQRVCVLRVQDRTFLVGVTEGSITTLAELQPKLSAAQKEADEPQIFADLLSWRKDAPSAAPERAGVSEPEHAPAKDPDSLLGEGPVLFAPGERPPR